MSRTRTLLCATLGRDLGSLAIEYFIPANSGSHIAIGKAGCFEECINFHDRHASQALYGACRRGYSRIVSLLVGRAHLSNQHIEAAYRSGDPATISTIELQSNSVLSIMNLDRGLWGACRGGHLEIARNLLEQGAKHISIGMTDAALGGHIQLIDLMHEHGANNIREAMHAAFVKGTRNALLHLASMRPLHVTCDCGTPVAEHIANISCRQKT